MSLASSFLSSFLVPVSDIFCSSPVPVDAALLHRAAQLILDSGGVINPPVLRKIGTDRYEVISGRVEYYAAVEAEKLDPMRGELINAYIIQPGQEQTIAEQIALFRQDTQVVPVNIPSSQAADQAASGALIQQVGTMITALEERLATMLKAMEERIEQRLTGIEANIEATKTIMPGEIWHDNRDLDETAFIEFINNASEQDIKGLKSGVQSKPIQQLVAMGEKESYQSKQDVLARLKGKGFTEATYKKLLDKWQATYIPAPVNTTDVTLESSVVETLTVAAQSIPELPQPSQEAASIPHTTLQAPVTESQQRSVTPDIIVDTQIEVVVPVQVASPPIQPTLAIEQRDFEDNATTLIPESIPLPSTPLSGIDKLNTMNKAELAVTLHHLKISKNLIESIIDQRPFVSFAAIKIKGLGPKKVEAIREKFTE